MKKIIFLILPILLVVGCATTGYYSHNLPVVYDSHLVGTWKLWNGNQIVIGKDTFTAFDKDGNASVVEYTIIPHSDGANLVVEKSTGNLIMGYRFLDNDTIVYLNEINKNDPGTPTAKRIH